MKLKVIVGFICTFALSLVLVGCAGGGGDNSKNFVGEWTLTSMETGGETIAQEDIAMLEAFGMSASLTLKEDKTAVLDVFGEALKGTWEAKSATTAKLTLDGEGIEANLKDGKLSLVSGEDTLIFTKKDTKN